MTLPPQVRGIRAAFIFMTRVPVGGFPYSKEDFRWASAYFPLVGLVVGTLGAMTFWFASPLGTPVASVLSIAMTVWATGAFHEDGLADSMDALGGSHSRKKLHEILKDSRIGTYGGSALVLSLLLRVLLLSELPSDVLFDWTQGVSAPMALPLVHSLSRTGPVVVMANLDYVAGGGAKGAAVASGAHGVQAILAILTSLGLLAGLSLGGLRPALAVSLILTASVVTMSAATVWKKRAGGFTGDFLGATEQFLEMGLLLVLVGSAKWVSGEATWPAWL